MGRKKKGRGLWLHKPKKLRVQAVVPPVVSVSEPTNDNVSSELPEVTVEDCDTDDKKELSENGEAGEFTALQQAKGDHYDRVKSMCDGLWKEDGIDSMMLMADPMSRLVWSCGSANGTIFLQSLPNFSQKFLKFCIDMEERLNDKLLDEMDEEMDLDIQEDLDSGDDISETDTANINQRENQHADSQDSTAGYTKKNKSAESIKSSKCRKIESAQKLDTTDTEYDITSTINDTSKCRKIESAQIFDTTVTEYDTTSTISDTIDTVNDKNSERVALGTPKATFSAFLSPDGNTRHEKSWKDDSYTILEKSGTDKYVIMAKVRSSNRVGKNDVSETEQKVADQDMSKTVDVLIKRGNRKGTKPNILRRSSVIGSKSKNDIVGKTAVDERINNNPKVNEHRDTEQGESFTSNIKIEFDNDISQLHGDKTTPWSNGDKVTPKSDIDGTTRQFDRFESTPQIDADKTTPLSDTDKSTPQVDRVESTPKMDADKTTPLSDTDKSTAQFDKVESTPQMDADKTTPLSDTDRTTPQSDHDSITPQSISDKTMPHSQMTPRCKITPQSKNISQYGNEKTTPKFERDEEDSEDQENFVKLDDSTEETEVVSNENVILIVNGGIGVEWPIDKVYEKTKEKLYRCKFCNKTGLTPSMLIRHVRSVHGSSKPYRCTICKKTFKDKEYVVKHARVHLTKTQVCDICNKKFVDIAKLKKHKKIHENGIIHHCDICESEFNSREQLKIHCSSAHGKMKQKCQHCGSLFRDGFSLKRHIQVKHTPSIVPEKCDVCSKEFKLKENMLLHKKRFHEAKFSCNICGSKQPTANTLKKHVETVHEKKNKMICDVCGKTFLYRYRFLIHKRAHAGDLPFKCSYCDKRYTNKESCKHHENTHTRENVYICDICGQRYLQYGHLTRHKMLHDKTCKPVKCKYCDAGFRTYSAFRSHIFKEHKEAELSSGSGIILTCEYCGKHFAHPAHLQSHIHRHTGEKPYACEICGKKFNDKSNLRQHKFTHDSATIYRCSLCPKTFAQQRGFRSHLKCHGVSSDTKMTEASFRNKVPKRGNQDVLRTEGNALSLPANFSQTTAIPLQLHTEMGNEIMNVGDFIIAGQEGIDVNAPTNTMETEEVFILDTGKTQYSISVQPEHVADFKRIHQTTGGSALQIDKVPELGSEFQVEGQNYVVLPKNDSATSTILVWEEGPT